ncbi:hypothetical protein E2562_014612 [Oryza meyeriana var. granulata]|uniref:Uncharacterized protein n=1 Tax=Oryza meyeriana var. granulata TaxID=110450 RepID=A0A6G1DYW5_9ORYZ|nr:hypothetical protein E2562_014612 [Oryza meyeriana var. granulata]
MQGLQDVTRRDDVGRHGAWWWSRCRSYRTRCTEPLSWAWVEEEVLCRCAATLEAQPTRLRKAATNAAHPCTPQLPTLRPFRCGP